MNIRVNRFRYGGKATIGRMFIDGVTFCYTLEDEVRDGPKVQGETAIPEGTYKVVISMSKRFGRLMPEILGVPNFTGVRAHAGNTDDDTDGCFLLGMKLVNENFISESKAAFNAFFEKLQAALKNGEEVLITVHNG